MSVGNRGQGCLEIGEGLDAIDLAGLDERGDAAPGDAAFVVTGKEGILAVDSLPLDFSPWSGRAIDLARRVAPEARLVLMHSYAIPHEEKLRFAGVDDDTLDHYRQQARQDGREHLEALIALSGLAPPDYQLCLTEGQAAQKILAEAKEGNCDLIVIGKHGRQAAEELLLGSVTNHVIAEAGCDVLVSTAHSD